MNYCLSIISRIIVPKVVLPVEPKAGNTNHQVTISCIFMLSNKSTYSIPKKQKAINDRWKKSNMLHILDSVNNKKKHLSPLFSVARLFHSFAFVRAVIHNRQFHDQPTTLRNLKQNKFRIRLSPYKLNIRAIEETEVNNLYFIIGCGRLTGWKIHATRVCVHVCINVNSSYLILFFLGWYQ